MGYGGKSGKGGARAGYGAGNKGKRAAPGTVEWAYARFGSEWNRCDKCAFITSHEQLVENGNMCGKCSEDLLPWKPSGFGGRQHVAGARREGDGRGQGAVVPVAGSGDSNLQALRSLCGKLGGSALAGDIEKLIAAHNPAPAASKPERIEEAINRASRDYRVARQQQAAAVNRAYKAKVAHDKSLVEATEATTKSDQAFAALQQALELTRAKVIPAPVPQPVKSRLVLDALLVDDPQLDLELGELDVSGPEFTDNDRVIVDKAKHDANIEVVKILKQGLEPLRKVAVRIKEEYRSKCEHVARKRRVAGGEAVPVGGASDITMAAVLEAACPAANSGWPEEAAAVMEAAQDPKEAPAGLVDGAEAVFTQVRAAAKQAASKAAAGAVAAGGGGAEGAAGAKGSVPCS